MNPILLKTTQNATKKYTEDLIVKLIECLIDNIFVQFGGRVFKQTIGTLTGTNGAPLALMSNTRYKFDIINITMTTMLISYCVDIVNIAYNSLFTSSTSQC